MPRLIKHIHRKLEFITIEWEWVKGHNDNDGNKNADYLAETALVNYGLPPRGYNKNSRLQKKVVRALAKHDHSAKVNPTFFAIPASKIFSGFAFKYFPYHH